MNKSLIVARKEFTDAITSKRFWLVVGLFVLLYIANIFITSSAFRTGELGPIRLMLQIGSNVASTVGLMAPILGIALAFDAISGERERGTLRILLSRPIYREDVINGKIMSALAVIGLTITISSLLSVSASILLQGITVTSDDIVRLCLFIVLSILFSFAYYTISLFISTFSSRSGHSLIISLGTWIFFALILPLLGSLISYVILGPAPAINTAFRPGQQIGNFTRQLPQSYIDYQAKVAQITNTVQMISINHHFSLISDSLFGSVRAAFGQEVVREIDLLGILSSRLIDLLVLMVFPVIFLVASYATFTRRQEK